MNMRHNSSCFKCLAAITLAIMLLGGCKHIPRGEKSLPHREQNFVDRMHEEEARTLAATVPLADGSVMPMPATREERFSCVLNALHGDIQGTPPAWVVELLEYDAVGPAKDTALPWIGMEGDISAGAEPKWIGKAEGGDLPSDTGHLGAVPNAKSATGYAPAQDLLARMTLEGDGVKQDSARAFNLALEAARQGFTPAQVLVATLYSLGHGIKRDEEQAFFWLREAARDDDPEAMAMLADVYRQGRGVTQDDEEAFLWTNKASQAGVTRAHLWLGLHYYYGQGTPKDGALAAALLRPFADLGDVESQRCMGILAYEGRGVKQNFHVAQHYFTMAAQSKDKEAFLYLGVMTHKGQGTTKDAKPNMSQAREYFLAGAKLGEPRCMSLLASMLELGEGGPVDKVAAHAWYSLARHYGDKACTPLLAALTQTLETQELADAHTLALTLQMAMPAPQETQP